MTYIIHGNPITKKNSQRLVYAGGRPRIIPSAQFKAYETAALYQLNVQALDRIIDYPVNIGCVYYMQTLRKVDLCNLLEATMDILVDAKIIADDNAKIVAGHDGSTVRYDKDNPRVEIVIKKMEEVE